MLTLSEIAAAVGGRVVGPACSIRAVVTDSRTVTPGCLFVALRGERFDGHKFVGEAARQGAAAALIDREPEPGGLPAVLVPDARLALGRLAAYWRRQLKAKVVAITGSNGKTSVKEMTAHILSRAAACLATEGNLNNDIGVPLTVLRCLKSHRYAVVEMGMNRPGEIANLAAIVAPDVACVTNAGLAHLAGLGSVRAIAEEKGQVYAALSARGVAVVNADDQFADYWRGLAPGRVVTYGLKAAADVSATYALGPAGSELMLKTPSAPAPLPVTLAVLGRHNVVNALAAAAIAVALDIPGQTIREGLGAVRPVHGRLAAGPGYAGSCLIDDTYNANPDSARAALDVLAHASGERWFVLGDMAELGPDAARLHGAFGEAAAQSGIEHLLTFGDLASHASHSFGARARHYRDIEELIADLRPALHKGAVVLVKGSRSTRMERVVAGLRDTGGRHVSGHL